MSGMSEKNLQFKFNSLSQNLSLERIFFKRDGNFLSRYDAYYFPYNLEKYAQYYPQSHTLTFVKSYIVFLFILILYSPMHDKSDQLDTLFLIFYDRRFGFFPPLPSP